MESEKVSGIMRMIPFHLFSIVPTDFMTVPLHARMNAEYTFVAYDDRRCEHVIRNYGSPIELRAFRHLANGAPRADLCRMLVLKYLGGVYIESDVQLIGPLRTIHDNLHQFSLFTGFYWPFEFVGCVPWHPIIVAVVETQVRAIMHQVRSKASCDSHACLIRATGAVAYWSAIGAVTRAHGCRNRFQRPGPADCRASNDTALRNMYVCARNSSSPSHAYSCGVARHLDCRSSASRRPCAHQLLVRKQPRPRSRKAW